MAEPKKTSARPAFAKPLRLLEGLLLLPRWRCEQPQLFILGLPRSGTTLVYQYVVHRLSVAYFTNAVGRYTRSPCVATLWERSRSGGYRSDFSSNYGATTGAGAPHEAGNVWARFFGYEDYVRFADVPVKDARRLQNIIACIQRRGGDVPFVNKNVKHLLRIDALAGLFPKATFLVVERDLDDVALSVLRGRHANFGNSSEWWSVRPPDYEAILAHPPSVQVAMQVRSLQRRMDDDLARQPAARVLRVNYRDFCARPDSLIELLREKWTPAAPRNEPVARFDFKSNAAKTDEEREMLRALHELQPCPP